METKASLAAMKADNFYERANEDIEAFTKSINHLEELSHSIKKEI